MWPKKTRFLLYKIHHVFINIDSQKITYNTIIFSAFLVDPHAHLCTNYIYHYINSNPYKINNSHAYNTRPRKYNWPTHMLNIHYFRMVSWQDVIKPDPIKHCSSTVYGETISGTPLLLLLARFQTFSFILPEERESIKMLAWNAFMAWWKLL